VLARLLNDTLDHRIRLGQTLQTFYQLGQVSRVLGLHSNPHNRRHTELHYTHVVRILERCNGPSFHQKLIHTNQSTDVTTRNILNGLNVTPHHENSPLDCLLIQIFLLPWDVIWTHDTSLHACCNLAREDASEGIESSLVRGWHHF